MTTHIDYARIEREVAEYYRYATFSHKWEDNEPLFENVVRIVVYELEESLTHNKLQMFCKIVRVPLGMERYMLYQQSRSFCAPRGPRVDVQMV